MWLFSNLVVTWYKAQNLLITVADTVDNIFFTVEEDNLCGRIHGQLEASAHITCNTALYGRLVQVRNDPVLNEVFHLAEVEVFGF